VADVEAPTWLAPWCDEQLGSAPAEVLFTSAHMSSVHGLRLHDGRQVVVKARDDSASRVISCLRAQKHLASAGFPCPRPLTSAVLVGRLTVHAEVLLAGGYLLGGTSLDVARRYGLAFARLMALLDSLQVRPPLPNPYWLGWEHGGTGLWPQAAWLDERDQGQIPDFVVATASRSTRRLRAASLPNVLGHGDFEAQNLRWINGELWAVHDWDSLAWFPEAALVGAASGAFSSAETPTLAPFESSEAFIAAYQDRRGRSFSQEEQEVAWAASLWPAVHNARGEALFQQPPVTTLPLSQQAEERLRRAGA
jgi:Ser/Thr protein kinase RdoA (MazF antagonist)